MPDIFYWLAAALAHAGRSLRRLWTWASWAEVALVAVNVVVTVLAIVALSVTDAGIMWAVTFGAIVTTGSTVRVTAWNARERWQADEELTAVLRSERTGAPRVAQVPCGNGHVHRFLYGPRGWEEAGPSTEVFPDDNSRVST